MQRRTLLKSAVLPVVTVSAGVKAQAAPDGTAPEEIAVDVAIAGAGFAGLTAAVTAART